MNIEGLTDAEVRALYRSRHVKESYQKRLDDLNAVEDHAEERQIYSALVKELADADVLVEAVQQDLNVNGEFDTVDTFDGPRPIVRLFRKEKRMIVDLVEELITLAHERGHWRSWTEHGETAEFTAYIAARDNVNKQIFDARNAWNTDACARRARGESFPPCPEDEARLHPSEIALILGEEQLAWDYAAAVLERLEFSQMELVAERRADGLDGYRKRLVESA